MQTLLQMQELFQFMRPHHTYSITHSMRLIVLGFAMREIFTEGLPTRQRMCLNSVSHLWKAVLQHLQLHPVQRQLIVFGNVNDIFYYTFEGELVRRKQLTSDFGDKRQLYAAAYHKGHVLTVEAAAERESQVYRQELVKYDTAFQRIDARALQAFPLERSGEPIGYMPPSIAIDSAYDLPYAYAPSLQPQYLLRDTLYIWQQRQQALSALEQERISCPLLPVRMGRRFWVASYQRSSDGESGYTFCYDTLSGRYWQSEEGLEDDFYHTGKIAALKALDSYGDCYYFTRQAEQMEQPLSTAGDVILFLVSLRG